MMVLFIFLIGIVGSNHDECYSQSRVDQYWLSLNSDQSGQTASQIFVLKKTNASIDFRIEIPKVGVTEFNEGNQKYQLLTIPEYGHTDEIGAPKLPFIIKSIAIPASCSQNDIHIQISFSEFSVFKGYQICPFPEIAEKRLPNGEVKIIEEYKEDPKIYSANDFYPSELIKIDKVGFVRDQKLALLTICPFQYNPVSKELKIFYRIDISLRFSPGEILDNKGWGLWNKLEEELFLNYEFIGSPSG